MNGANLIQATLCVRKTFLAIFGDFPCIDDIHRHHLTAVFEKRCLVRFATVTVTIFRKRFADVRTPQNIEACPRSTHCSAPIMLLSISSIDFGSFCTKCWQAPVLSEINQVRDCVHFAFNHHCEEY